MSIELCLGSGEYYIILYFNNDKQGVLKLCHIVYFKQGWLKFKVRHMEGGGLKYYLFAKFRAYLLKNIKNL